MEGGSAVRPPCGSMAVDFAACLSGLSQTGHRTEFLGTVVPGDEE